MFAGETEISFNRIRDQVRIPMYGCDCYAYGYVVNHLVSSCIKY